MTKGMDINSGQSNISITAAKSAGIQFTIVKAGGYNVTPMYVAPFYHGQIDRCIAAAMPRGHMWVTGTGDATTQADYFVDHLYRYDKATDILALDNELLPDSNSQFWNDSKCATFINRVYARLGISGPKVWIYMDASNVRSQSWPGVIATKCRRWVASWGPNNGSRTAPDVGTQWPSWDVQQYTSVGSIDGYQVDLDYSPLAISEMFGSGSGSTGTGTLVLSADDRTAIQGYIDRALNNMVDGLAPGVWQHPVNSAVDNGSHWIQTYAAWAQRDTAGTIATLTGGDPEKILVKENSTPAVWALNPQKGTKRALTAGQLTVMLNCGLSYQTVADGALAAFTTVTGNNASPVAALKYVINNTVVSFNATSSRDPDGSISSYAWDFGDGIHGAGATVSHTYVNGQTYTAILTVTDNSGATAIDVKEVPIGTTVILASDITLASGATGTLRPVSGVDYSTTSYAQTTGPLVTIVGTAADQRTFTAPTGPTGLGFRVLGFAQSGQNISIADIQYTIP